MYSSKYLTGNMRTLSAISHIYAAEWSQIDLCSREDSKWRTPLKSRYDWKMFCSTNLQTHYMEWWTHFKNIFLKQIRSVSFTNCVLQAVVYEKPGFQGSSMEVDSNIFSFSEGEAPDSEKPTSVGSLKVIGGMWVFFFHFCCYGTDSK